MDAMELACKAVMDLALGEPNKFGECPACKSNWARQGICSDDVLTELRDDMCSVIMEGKEYECWRLYFEDAVQGKEG